MTIKKIGIFTIVTLILMGVAYFGMTSYLEQKADAEEAYKPFTAYTYDYSEYGYKPRTELDMNKRTLESFMKLCDHTITTLDSGDLLINFTVDENQRWLVKISNPEDIRWIQKLERSL